MRLACASLAGSLPPSCSATGCSLASKPSSRVRSPCSTASAVTISVYSSACFVTQRCSTRQGLSVQSIIGATEKRCRVVIGPAYSMGVGLVHDFRHRQNGGGDAQRGIQDFRPGMQAAFAAFPFARGQGTGLGALEHIVLAAEIGMGGNAGLGGNPWSATDQK